MAKKWAAPGIISGGEVEWWRWLRKEGSYESCVTVRSQADSAISSR